MKLITFTLGLVFLWLTSSSCLAIEIANKNPPQTFIGLSDIHFDPFASCQKATLCPLINELVKAPASDWDALFKKQGDTKLAGYGHDTNYALLESTLAATQQQAQQNAVQFVLILGDFLGHDFKSQYRLYSGDISQIGYQQFVNKTLAFLTNQIRNSLGNIPVYPVIGNNDSYSGDYNTIPNGSFFKDTAQLWTTLVDHSDSTFKQTFPIAGYYAVTPNSEKSLRLIVLNTVLLSKKTDDNQVAHAAAQQFSWLDQQLSLAALQHQKVWLAFHIPPGINVYNTVNDSAKGQIISFWKPDSTAKFLEILKQHPQTVMAILSGHIHMDGFQLVPATTLIPETFVPAVSPLFGNNSSLKVYSFDKNSEQLQNFITYHVVDNGKSQTWQQEYSFNAAYQPHCANCNLIAGMKKLQTTGKLANLYMQYFASGNLTAQPITKGKWLPYYWCSIYNIAPLKYQACVQKLTPSVVLETGLTH